ncbi:MAG: hypothetical protein KKC55_15815, partial [Gammaproteobacteria bacterium]|nr:hypothetical protein [Gammaproteobacteria bacterium]
MDEQWTISSEKYFEWLIEVTAYSIGALLGDGYIRAIPTPKGELMHITEVAAMDREIAFRVNDDINKAFGTDYEVIRKILPNGSRLFIARAYRRI